MKKLLLVTMLSICIVSLSLFATSGAARAASPISGSASSAAFSQELATLQKHCAVVNVHLNGLQHTATCAVARGTKRSGPNGIYRDSCYASWAMEIDNYGLGSNGLWNGQLCFSGSGVADVEIYEVNLVYNAEAVNQGFAYQQGNNRIYRTLLGYNEYSWGDSNNTGVRIYFLCIDDYC